jgi:hypothetical protein
MKPALIFLTALTLTATAQTPPASQQISAQEDLLWSVFAKGDSVALHDLMLPDYLHVEEEIADREIVRQFLAQCHVNSYKLGEKQVRLLTPDSALVVYPIAEDFTCGPKDKPQQMTGSFNATSVWVRKPAGSQWKLQAHIETPAAAKP